MTATMSKPEPTVRLAVSVPESIRRRLRTQAVAHSLDMGDLIFLILEHVLPQIEADDIAPELEKAITKKRQEPKKRKPKPKPQPKPPGGQS